MMGVIGVMEHDGCDGCMRVMHMYDGCSGCEGVNGIWKWGIREYSVIFGHEGANRD